MANETTAVDPPENEALLRAAAKVGGQAALARELSVEPPTVNQWAKGRRPIPDEKCVAIEFVTAGESTCEQLAPGRKWVRVADAAWPHPGGRPLLDLSEAANDGEKQVA